MSELELLQAILDKLTQIAAYLNPSNYNYDWEEEENGNG